MEENNFIFKHECPVKPGGTIYLIRAMEVVSRDVSHIEITRSQYGYTPIEIIIHWAKCYGEVEHGHVSLSSYGETWFTDEKQAKYKLKYMLQDALSDLNYTDPDIFNEDNDE